MQYVIPGIDSVASVALGLIVNPKTGYLRAQYAMDSDSMIDLGDGFYVSGALLEALKGPQAIAVGVIATARGSTSQFNATWDHISIEYLPGTTGEWYVLQDGSGCQDSGSGPCCFPRHEAAYTQSGDKFYLMGGREQNSNVNIYNPVTEIWSIGAAPPDSSLHHFQAVDYYGLIIAAGAFTGEFPLESNVPNIMIYDPVANKWYKGPSIPVSRRRGSAGAVINNDTLYLLGGLTNGHVGGCIPWMDSYDFVHNSWSVLPNAPHKRDHFHLAEKDGKIYAAAGRHTSLDPLDSLFLATEPKVDEFDIASSSWEVLPNQIPTQRGGAATTILNNELVVIGGEREPVSSKSATEAMDLATDTWRELDTLNVPRNGMQAIENNGGIYVASGAKQQGGGQITRTAEAFYLYGETEPVLSPTVASMLTGADQDFGEVPIQDSATADLYMYNVSGNQAILLQRMTMFDSTAFVIDTTLTFPRFLKPGDSLHLPLKFLPTAIQSYSDTIYLTHSGANAPLTKIVLTGEGVFNWLGGTRAYVDTSATGNGLGYSWTNAFTTISAALNAAVQFSQINEVWIAKGTYCPGPSRASSFVLRDSLAVYGGFDGTEILLSQRDIDAFPVTLSGDIGVAGDSTDNVYHVVMMTGTTQPAVLDGVTISDGLANGSTTFDKYGAGIFNLGTMVLRNSKIRNCTSINPGSALVNSGSNAQITLDHVLFQQNSDPHLVNEAGGTMTVEGTQNILEQQ